MSTDSFDWPRLLRRWSANVFASGVAENLPDSARKQEWLGFPPASEAQITAAEHRFKIPLPPSYKAFLRVSNGWRRPTHFIDLLLPVEQIDWFRKSHKDWIKAYTVPATLDPGQAPDAEYFGYGEHASDFKTSHLKETLQISQVGDAAVYLLNPQVISKDGEWEAWFLANWLPGVRRYRSFVEMMQAEYHQFAGTEWEAPVGVVGELPDEYVGSPGSPKRRVKKRMRPAEPKILNKALSKWTADELLSFLQNPDFDIIHGECLEGLAMMGDRRAIEPLFAALSKGDAAAAHWLKKLTPDRLQETLLQLLADWKSIPYIVHVASAILTEFRDERAVPLLVQIMGNDQREWEFVTNYVAAGIAQFGKAGFEALIDQLEQKSPIVRRRAAVGLLSTNRPEARAVCERLLADSDSEIRKIAELGLNVLPPNR